VTAVPAAPTIQMFVVRDIDEVLSQIPVASRGRARQFLRGRQT